MADMYEGKRMEPGQRIRLEVPPFYNEWIDWSCSCGARGVCHPNLFHHAHEEPRGTGYVQLRIKPWKPDYFDHVEGFDFK